MGKSYRFRYLFCFLLILGLSCFAGMAQEYRGQISGKVLDPSGAVIPGAQVVITNNATNTSSNTIADDKGTYTVLYLVPGKYHISVEAPGFKKLVREGIELRVDDQLNINLTLTIGGASEVVNVTAGAALLETESANAGQVIDQRRIADLPLSDGNPFTLERLAPGVAYQGDLKFSRPFDNNGTSDMTVDGSPGRSEFTLDGSPNTDRRRVAYVPPSDAVQEFNLQTSAFDASIGHSAGALVNVVSRGGTNAFHGALYDQHWQQRWNATPHFTRLAYERRHQQRQDQARN